MKDRTGEFWSIIQGVSGGQSLQPVRIAESEISKTEFMSRASEIGQGIFQVGNKLEKLAKYAKNKSIFDDKQAEIEEITFQVKKEISVLNQQISSLQNERIKGNSKQAEEYNSNVVVSLQSKLASHSNSFKNVLEVRTQNMKIQKSRRDQFSSDISASVASPTVSTVEYPVQTYQQLELIEQQNTHLSERHTAIETIETTIAELGQIFQQLAHMVAGQGETIQRIDENVEDALIHVEKGQDQLMKYWNSVSSNRWLMAKIFSILIVFIFIFSIFFA